MEDTNEIVKPSVMSHSHSIDSTLIRMNNGSSSNVPSSLITGEEKSFVLSNVTKPIQPNTKLQLLFDNFGLEFLPSDLQNEEGEKRKITARDHLKGKAEEEEGEGEEEKDDAEDGREDTEDIVSLKGNPLKGPIKSIGKGCTSSSSLQSSSSEKADSKELFRIAFVNYRLTITDGQPQNIPGFDYLFIGSIGAAYNYENLIKTGITHILCLSEVIKLRFPESFLYKRIAINDKVTFNLQPYLQECYDFIDEAKSYLDPVTQQPGRILVHCYQGISRSSAICCAYMIYSSRGQITRDAALERIKAIRPKACPNTGFMKLLKNVEEQVNLQVHLKAGSNDDNDSRVSEITDTEVEEDN